MQLDASLNLFQTPESFINRGILHAIRNERNSLKKIHTAVLASLPKYEFELNKLANELEKDISRFAEHENFQEVEKFLRALMQAIKGKLVR